MHVILKTIQYTDKATHAKPGAGGRALTVAVMPKMANTSVPAIDQMIKICELLASRFCICMCTTVYYVQPVSYTHLRAHET